MTGDDDGRSGRPLYNDPSLRIIFSITLMAVMGVSIISPVIPTIKEHFQVSAETIGLLITVFTLPGVILTPFLGVLADRMGRKRILVPSLLLFGLAGGACSFARDWETLLLLRFVQGAGAAALGSINVTLIGDLYSGKNLNAAMGYNSAVLSVGTAAYPAIGGGLAVLGWYYPFAVSLLAVPIGMVVLFFLDNPEPEGQPAFWTYLTNAVRAMWNRRMAGLFLGSIMAFIQLYGCVLTYLPLYMKQTFEASPPMIGAILTVAALGSAATATQLGRLARMFAPVKLIVAGFFLHALSLVSVYYLPVLGSSPWFLSIPALVYGAANALAIPSIQAMIAGLAPMEQRGAFMSINGMVLRLGQTLGPIVMAAVFAFGGMDAVFFAGAGVAALTAVMSWVLIFPGPRELGP